MVFKIGVDIKKNKFLLRMSRPKHKKFEMYL